MKINYYNFSNFNDDYLITNEMGFHSFLSKLEFDNLISEQFDNISEEKTDELKDKFFIYDVEDDVFIEKVKDYYRDNKRYLFDATCLHIFVMTNACNMSCIYCQAQDSEQKNKGMMTKEIAEKAVDIALQSPSRSLTFEFQGGEPLTNFDTIKHIVEYTEGRKIEKNINYTVVTNTLLLDEEKIEFFEKYKFDISTSLDGKRELHNFNRPKISGDGTFDVVIKNIHILQERNIPVGAIQTTTKKSLLNPVEIVESYVENDLHYIFLRPLTPLGYAKEHWDEIGYTAEEFVSFYREALKEIIKRNISGYKIAEGHACVFLRKIIALESDNYMELRSPCGAGVGQMAYYYDGLIYTCDEGRMLAEMGLPEFKIGCVDNSYDEMMESKACKITCQSSVLESIPQCCDCAYHPYCGVCPVVNYAMENNIYSREANGYKCKIYKGILDTLFEFIHDDNQIVEIFKTWL